MVSYTVRPDKVKNYMYYKAVLTTGASAMQRFVLLLSWIISVLGHKFLNDFKLESVQMKMLRQGNKMKKMH